jgi:hypothetical protein
MEGRFVKRFPLRALSPFFFCIVLAALGACGDDDNGVNPDGVIPTDLTDPAAVIDSHGRALEQKDYAAYEALLDNTFEFVPLPADAQDFPWIQGGSWPKATELEIIGNMFDPEFSGEESPVDAIEANFTVLSQQTLPTGRIELTTNTQGRVLTSSMDGWSFDTRVVFELVSREGFLRIAKMKEVPVTFGARSVEESSWGSIKSLYRTPIPTNLTDPAAVIESHELALRQQDIGAYAALLDDQFEFYPLEQDAIDFPWMDGDSWPKAEEVSMIGNMCDPHFAGENNPIDAIDADITILSQQPLTEGRIALDCIFQGRVLTAPNDGWSVDTRFLFEVIPRGKFLRILKITEIPRTRGGTSSVESESWGRMKAVYR